MAESRITVARVYGEVSHVKEDVARLRGELNGNLPRLIAQVDRLAELIQRQQEGAREYQEGVRVHEREIAGLKEALKAKADEKAVEEAHKKIYFFIRVSLYAMAGAVGLMALKAAL